MRKILFAVMLVVAVSTTQSIAADKSKVKPQGKVTETAQKTKVELIQPFGGLSWEGGLPDVVNKLMNMAGVEKVILYTVQPEEESAVDLMKLPKDAVTKALIGYYGLPTGEAAEIAPSLDEAPYYLNDKNEVVRLYETSFSTKIIASPVIISGVLFDMEIGLTYTRGLPLKHPASVVIARSGKHQYAISMIIRSLTLTSNSPTLASKYHDISRIVLDKYGKYTGQLSFDNKNADGKVEDSVGTSLSADVNSSAAMIHYASGYYADQLSDEHNKFLAGLEQQKNKGKKDMGGAL